MGTVEISLTSKVMNNVTLPTCNTIDSKLLEYELKIKTK